MEPAPYHPQEIERLASLVGLHLDAVEPEPLFDQIAQQAAALCHAPYAIVTLVGEHEQCFLGNQGMPGGGTPREESICSYTLLEMEAFVVEDLRDDVRFAEMAIVKGAPYIRFYAGVPLFDGSGLPLGAVCVLDTEPRRMGVGPIFALQRLAQKASVLLEGRRFVAHLLGAQPHPVALHRALKGMNAVMAPLFASHEGFRLADR